LIFADFVLFVPGLGEPLPGLALSGIAAAIGMPLMVRSLGHHPILRGMASQAMAWRFLVLCFTVFWVVPYYMVGGSDAVSYHGQGVEIAELLRAGAFDHIDWSLGTGAMRCIVGFFYLPFGGNLYAMYFISAFIGLAAVVYYVKAFSLIHARPVSRKYALLLVFLPSFAMWSTTFGKDSFASLGFGMIAYGYATWLKKRHGAAMTHVGIGVVLLGLVRPHMALLAIVALFVTELICVEGGSRKVSVAKLVRLTAAGILIAFLWPVVRDFVHLDDSSASGAMAISRATVNNNSVGGSAVDTPEISSPLQLAMFFPLGVVRVLFRPFPWEAHNINAALSALENLFILFFTLRRARFLPRLLGGIRTRPFACFCLVLSLELLLILGPLPNLGLLSRERAQLLPFFFALMLTSSGRFSQRLSVPAYRPVVWQSRAAERWAARGYPVGTAGVRRPDPLEHA
jgi:hypothetical protein